MRRRTILLLTFGIIATLFTAALGYTKKTAASFSQEPAFVAYFNANPPVDAAPTAADRNLLERWRPRIFLSPENARPISFYDDYIAFGELRGGAGNQVIYGPTREQLNALKDDPGARFEHRPSGSSSSRPIVFGRVDRDILPIGGAEDDVRQRELMFLTYHLVFRTSGLPAGIPAWLGWLSKITRWDQDWHQLDNFTAATVVMDEALTPLALMLQQHHFVRSYLFGVDLPWPTDAGPAIDVAIGSNELYPHEAGRAVRPMVGSMTLDALEYLVTGEGQPLFSGNDVTNPTEQLAYTLEYLPPSDAFYVFQGRLGKTRLLPGREGPPGANYNSWPVFERPADQLVAGYWGTGDEALMPLIRRVLSQDNFDDDTRSLLAARFWQSLSERDDLVR